MAERQKLKVAVLGGGIIGVSSALCALEQPSLPVEVTLIAEKFSPNTTSDVAAGFIKPYLLGDITEETLRFWFAETFDFLLRISKSPEGGTCGVGLLSVYDLSRKHIEDPPYRDIFVEWRDMTDKELKQFNDNEYRFGKFVTTIFAECSKLIPIMMDRFQTKGGTVKQAKLTSLSQLAGTYDVVINCCGVEATWLVPDPAVYPIRGQTIRVRAPWVKHAVANDDCYILLNSDYIVCGGTKQENNWNLSPNAADRERIWTNCCALMPSLKRAEILEDKVGLRPGRHKPRLERDIIVNDKGERLEVIHNYGHGGSGVTVFWGCAKDAVKMLKEILHERSFTNLRHNL